MRFSKKFHLLINGEVNIHEELVKNFMDLLKACLDYNMCLLNGQVYTFPHSVGVPIGSPLGSLMGDVFVDLFENEVLNAGNPLVTEAS